MVFKASVSKMCIRWTPMAGLRGAGAPSEEVGGELSGAQHSLPLGIPPPSDSWPLTLPSGSAGSWEDRGWAGDGRGWFRPAPSAITCALTVMSVLLTFPPLSILRRLRKRTSKTRPWAAHPCRMPAQVRGVHPGPSSRPSSGTCLCLEVPSCQDVLRRYRDFWTC